MQTGYVLVSDDLTEILCLNKNKTDIYMSTIESTVDLNQSICLSNLTQIKSINKSLKDAGLIGTLEVVNIGRLYNKFY